MYGRRGLRRGPGARGGRARSGTAVRAALVGALSVALAGGTAGCAGPAMDVFAAPEPGWQPRPMERIAVVILGESATGRERVAGALARAGGRRGVRLVSLEELLSGLPDDVLAAGLDSAPPAGSDSAGEVDREDRDTTVLVRSDTVPGRRYGALASRAFREAGVEAILEISLDAGGRIVDPGIEHTVRECGQWVESRGRMICLRPREVTFHGDTLYRPWASYDVRLRDPESDEILWRGGAHTEGAYRRASEMHRHLVEEIVSELAEDGIVPPPGPSPDSGSPGRERP